MNNPKHMTREKLAQVVEQLQRILYYDNGSERWDPDQAHGSDTLGYVNALMHDFGLVPDGLIDETERRIQSLVERLQDTPAEDDMQHAVDDLVLDHCGTSKHWSNVNNQGFVPRSRPWWNPWGSTRPRS